MNRYAPLAERFWSKVNTTDDGCWPWTGAHGIYGTIKSGGKPLMAHRVAWQVAYGDIPEGRQVCHTCDNPICVRPSHLFIGSQSANIADMDRKGRRPQRSAEAIARMPRGDDHWQRRMPEKAARGERVGGAKLTAEKVTEIRRLRAEGRTLESLADEYGVRIGTIHYIVTRGTWKHVP